MTMLFEMIGYGWLIVLAALALAVEVLDQHVTECGRIAPIRIRRPGYEDI